MMSMRMPLALVLAASLSGCGFHLRGQLPIPESLRVMAVQSQEREVYRSLTEALGDAGVTVVENASDAGAVLDLYKVDFERTVRTIDNRGKVTGYNLTYTVNFRLTDASGKILRESAAYSLRDFNFDPDQVLQKEIEENALREDMVSDLTQKILRQLSTVTASILSATPIGA